MDSFNHSNFLSDWSYPFFEKGQCECHNLQKLAKRTCGFKVKDLVKIVYDLI